MACLPDLEEKGCDHVVFTSTVDLMQEYTTNVILEVTKPGPCLAMSIDYCEQNYLKRQRGGGQQFLIFHIMGKSAQEDGFGLGSSNLAYSAKGKYSI